MKMIIMMVMMNMRVHLWQCYSYCYFHIGLTNTILNMRKRAVLHNKAGVGQCPQVSQSQHHYTLFLILPAKADSTTHTTTTSVAKAKADTTSRRLLLITTRLQRSLCQHICVVNRRAAHIGILVLVLSYWYNIIPPHLPHDTFNRGAAHIGILVLVLSYWYLCWGIFWYWCTISPILENILYHPFAKKKIVAII